MKKTFSILILPLAVIIMAVTATACNNLTYFKDDYMPKYNDVFYDSAVDLINEDFRKANGVKTVGFVGDDEETELPEQRTFIITDSDRFDEVFVNGVNELNVDFDKRMVVVYTFAVEYVLPAFILDMNVNDGVLTIDYTIPQIQGAGSATTPYQRWFVVVLENLEVNEVIFNENITYYKDK